MLEGQHVLLLVPVGSMEQHGPHLPLGTDTMIAAAVAREAARQLGASTGPSGSRVLVAPPLGYGASGEHEGFPGTVSIGHEALCLLLVEFARSACLWARSVVFVNGHGGNTPTVARAVAQLRAEGRPVAWTSCATPDADAHAGHTETSILRHLAPWSVRVDLMAPGATEPVADLMPALTTDGVRAVSPNGVLGDPTTSSAEDGKRLFADLVVRVASELTDPDPDAEGRLRLPRRTPAAT